MADKTVINSTGFFSGKKKTLIRNSSGEGLEKFKYGDIIDGRYEVTGEIGLDSGEADIYTVKDLKKTDAALRVIKIYRRKDAVKEDVLLKLMNIDNPSVARILGRGEVSGFTYLVLPYYSRGSLASYIEQGITFTVEELKNLVIPSVAEGLKALHDAGILHKDLKPGNMMIADDDRHIVLIDFGISSVTAGATMVVTSTGKSPFYAAPETATGLFWSGSDYYSLGISLYELYSGVTPYQNAGADDVARYAQAERIPYPDDFDAELKELIDGLTYKDISYRNEPDNPNRRWGYEEIRKWLDGVHQQVPGEGVTVKEPDAGDFPYYFNGSNYYSLKDFTEALLSSWEEGKKELYRGFLSRNFELRDDRLAMDLCLRAESTFEANPQDGDVIFWKLMYSLSPEIRGIYWRNLHFESFGDLVNALYDIQNGYGEQGGIQVDAGDDAEAQKLSAFIRFFIKEKPWNLLGKCNQVDAGIIRITDNLTSVLLPDRSDIGDTTIRILAREVTGRTDFQVSGRIFQNPDELFRFINRVARADIMQYTDFYLTNRKMLQQISDSFDMVTRSNFMKNIPALLPDEEQKKSSMLSFDGYVFRNVEESLRFYDAYLKYMGGIYGEFGLRGHPEDIEYSSIPSIPSGFYDFRHNYRMFLRNAGLSEGVLRDIENRIGLSLISPVKGMISQGNTVLFGSYVQRYGRRKEPLEWLVLDVDKAKNRALLLAKSALKFIKYCDLHGNTGWSYPVVRRWLKDDFCKFAFSDEERLCLLPTLISVPAPDTTLSYSGVADSYVSEVFLLTGKEVESYLKDPESRKCLPTDYARACSPLLDMDGSCRWWLLTGGETIVSTRKSDCVTGDGSIGSYSCNGMQGVRPAVWIRT